MWGRVFKPNWMSFGLIVVGGLILAFCVYRFVVPNDSEAAHPSLTDGRVIHVDYDGDCPSGDTDCNGFYAPTFTFRAGGEQYTVKGTPDSQEVDVGDTIDVRYNPDNPKDAYDATHQSNFVKILAGVLFGLLPLAAGLWFLFPSEFDVEWEKKQEAERKAQT